MAKLQQFFTRYKKECIVALIFVICLGIFSINYAFAVVEPVRSIVIQSESTDFVSGEEGSWQITKSGYWTNYGEAEVTLDVDTNLMTNNEYTDIIFVLDISGSMAGEKLDRVKSDSKELISSLLSNHNNRAALITFDSTSQIISELTNNEELLMNEIDNLQDTGSTNYYQALVNVDSILQDYQKEDNREMIVLFLTDGYPNVDTPNQIGQFQYLKQAYPYITINGIQYEMGDSILSPIKEISDNQFIADMETLNNVLFDASVFPITYDTYQIIDYIDNENFFLESEDDIKVSQGSVELTEENGKQKITWTLDTLKSGRKANLTMNLKLKEEFVGQGGLYPTNESTEVISKIENDEEDVFTSQTPILADNFIVTYDGNAPSGCSVSNIPEVYNYSVFSTIEISDQIPSCAGYEFKGWKISTKDVTRVGKDYFIMPESDVVIRAEWSKLSTTKSMDGEIYVAPTLYKFMKQEAVMDNTSSEFVSSGTGIDFGVAPSDTNGKGVYIRSGTENNKYPILYYRGDVDNNHVKFGDFCWRIVRTTETGGTKLIYDGVPDFNGYCHNTGEDSQIGTSRFNQNNESPTDVGYMYGTRYVTSYINMNDAGSIPWIYGNDVTWNGSSYTLVDTVESNPVNWTIDRITIIGNGHRYTCMSNADTCSTVYYVHFTGTPNIINYVTLNNGINIEEALNEMLTTNQTDSTIKSYIDNWYSNNMTDYTKYLEDTIWCNDRSIYQLNSWDKDYSGIDGLNFGPYGKNANSPYVSDLSCPSLADSFTVSSENGNGKLTYPVALLTADEVTLGGLGNKGYSSSSYLNTNERWWSLSPYWFSVNDAYEFYISSRLLSASNVTISVNGVRPAISLRNELIVSRGTGTSENPYELVLK